jgi:hypothetical protein
MQRVTVGEEMPPALPALRGDAPPLDLRALLRGRFPSG